MGIALTDAEIDAFLRQAPTLILAVNRSGRAPLMVPMWFAWHAGAIHLNTALDSRKVACLRADPRVSCLVESGTDYFALKAVFMTGECRINDDQTEVNTECWSEWLGAVKPLYRECLRRGSMPPHLLRHYARPRATLIVRPRHVTSWDFAKIRR